MVHSNQTAPSSPDWERVSCVIWLPESMGDESMMLKWVVMGHSQIFVNAMTQSFLERCFVSQWFLIFITSGIVNLKKNFSIFQTKPHFLVFSALALNKIPFFLFFYLLHDGIVFPPLIEPVNYRRDTVFKSILMLTKDKLIHVDLFFSW